MLENGTLREVRLQGLPWPRLWGVGSPSGLRGLHPAICISHAMDDGQRRSPHGGAPREGLGVPTYRCCFSREKGYDSLFMVWGLCSATLGWMGSVIFWSTELIFFRRPRVS